MENSTYQLSDAKGPTSLEIQRQNYEENIKPFGEDHKIRHIASDDVRIQDLTSQSIEKANSMKDLEDQLIILNVNEFKLNNNDFEGILSDYKKWSLRAQPIHFNGGIEERNKVVEKVNQVIGAARNKFSEITKTS